MTPASTWWGALLGLMLGAGLLLVWKGLPVNRPVALEQRIEPWIAPPAGPGCCRWTTRHPGGCPTWLRP